ncbi:MAG: AAA family ATPase [Vulcanimicrobiaceae bacterium]
MADNTRARRLDNLANAKLLIKSGLYIFVSSGKTPLIPRFNKIDTQLSQDEREKAIEEYETKHGEPPIHVGATNDPAAVSKMFKRYPDAVPSIACGPSKLVVVDADVKDNGPELIGKHFEEHGLPEGTVVVPSQSGGKHYIFKDPDNKFTNAAGALKREYGCDLRGAGGQYVAPGSMREDGKTYGTRKDLITFLRAYTQATLPELPEHIVELIGTEGEAAQTVNDADISHVIRELEDTDWPEHVELFEPGIGTYDLDSLRTANPEFAELYDKPTGNRSDDRWAIAQMLLQHFPKMPVCDLAVFYEEWEGAGSLTDDGKGSGNYKLRDIAREWFKNKDRYVSSGDAFGAVVDDEDEDEAYSKIIEQERREEREAVAAIESSRGQLHSLSEIAVFCSPDYIIENMFVPGNLVMIHGPSNIGKTFSAWYMALCIAEGWKYFGRNTEQSGVLYCYGEGHSGMQNRALAYLKRYSPKTDNLIVRDGLPNFGLNVKEAKKAFRKAVKSANEQLAAKGLQPLRVVFLDTFAKAVAGAEENSTREMQPIMDELRSLGRELGVAVIPIHHSGKDASQGARGASAIFADVDVNIEIVDPNSDKRFKSLKVKPGHLVMVLPKMRDGGKSGVAEFKLEEVRLGENKWGNPVTSMVVVPIEQPGPSDGSAMGAVNLDEDEAGSTTDELTPDQNEKGYADRLALCGLVLAEVTALGKLVGTDKQADALAVIERVPALVKLRKRAGDNFARDMKTALFGMEENAHGKPRPASRILLQHGYLEYTAGRGDKIPSQFTFRPRHR